MFRLRVRNTDGVYSSNELPYLSLLTLLSGVHGIYTFYLMLFVIILCTSSRGIIPQERSVEMQYI